MASTVCGISDTTLQLRVSELAVYDAIALAKSVWCYQQARKRGILFMILLYDTGVTTPYPQLF